MSTRADNFTQTQKLPDLFSDFLNDLTPHPINKDLGRIKNDAAIKQSLKNIIMTNLGERPFQPLLGSNVNGSLFEPNDVILEENLRRDIVHAIRFYEPRVRVIQVDVYTYPEQDRVAVNIVFTIINSIQVQNLNLILRRAR